MTKGPYCATGSPMGRPCSSRNSLVSGPLTSLVAAAPAARWRQGVRPPGVEGHVLALEEIELAPRVFTRGGRQRPARAGAIFSVQMARSDSACAAHESGGGAGGASMPVRRPATQAISVCAPAALVARWRGMSCDHSILKCGSAILLRAGRLSQIWNNSSGLGAALSSSGTFPHARCRGPR